MSQREGGTQPCIGKPLKERWGTFDLSFIRDLKDLANASPQKWDRARELCEAATRKVAEEEIRQVVKDQKKVEEVLSEVVSEVYTELIGRIGRFDHACGRGNVEANFVAFVKRTAWYTFLHWRDQYNRQRVLNNAISFEELASAMGMGQGDDEGPVNLEAYGQDIASERRHAQGSGADNTLRQAALSEIRDVINRLDDQETVDILMLNLGYGYTSKEIADQLGRKSSYIDTKIARGKERLRKLLVKKGIDGDYLDPDQWKNTSFGGGEGIG